MDEEVRCFTIELEDEPYQLVGQLVRRHDVGEIHPELPASSKVTLCVPRIGEPPRKRPSAPVADENARKSISVGAGFEPARDVRARVVEASVAYDPGRRLVEVACTTVWVRKGGDGSREGCFELPPAAGDLPALLAGLELRQGRMRDRMRANVDDVSTRQAP